MNTHSENIVIARINPNKTPIKETADWMRISSDVSRTQVQRIRSVVLDYGFLHSVTCRLVQHLYEYCESNNLSFTDQDRAQLIGYIFDKLPIAADADTDASSAGPTSSGPNLARGESRRDDRGPAQEVGPGNAGTGDKSVARGRKPSTKAQGDRGGSKRGLQNQTD